MAKTPTGRKQLAKMSSAKHDITMTLSPLRNKKEYGNTVRTFDKTGKVLEKADITIWVGQFYVEKYDFDKGARFGGEQGILQGALYGLNDIDGAIAATGGHEAEHSVDKKFNNPKAEEGPEKVETQILKENVLLNAVKLLPSVMRF